jgi:hypothetical protein
MRHELTGNSGAKHLGSEPGKQSRAATIKTEPDTSWAKHPDRVPGKLFRAHSKTDRDMMYRKAMRVRIFIIPAMTQPIDR